MGQGARRNDVTATKTIDINPRERAIDEIGTFLPPSARAALGKLFDMLESANVQVDDFLRTLLGIGESVIEQGLDWTIDGGEALVSKLYEIGVMDTLGNINPFLRDGAEIGLQLGMNTLKALTAADVAKILGVVVVAFAAPNLLLLNGPEFLEIVVELLTKLWHLP